MDGKGNVEIFSKKSIFVRGWPYIEWYLKYAKPITKYKNIHKGEDCFILGNGPSLNKTDLNQLGSYYTFGLNKIHLIFDKVDFRPSYHVAVNPLVVEQSIKDFEALPCQSFLAHKSSRKITKNKAHINFILCGGPLSFRKSLLYPISDGCTVTYVAMQIAYYMGFENVFLIGVDHNFKTKGSPNEKQFLKGDDVNHFDPNYFGNNEWQLPDLEGSEVSYRLAKHFYERNDRCIYDATVDGKLQVFPKLTFEEALLTCKKKK